MHDLKETARFHHASSWLDACDEGVNLHSPERTTVSHADTLAMDSSGQAHPAHSDALPRAEVVSEQDDGRGWAYEVLVRLAGVAPTRHQVTLSWRDHDYWCGGQVAPSRVVAAIVEYALSNGPKALPASFDCSTARRWLPKLDQELKYLL
jgi:hypothetical protein